MACLHFCRGCRSLGVGHTLFYVGTNQGGNSTGFFGPKNRPRIRPKMPFDKGMCANFQNCTTNSASMHCERPYRRYLEFQNRTQSIELPPWVCRVLTDVRRGEWFEPEQSASPFKCHHHPVSLSLHQRGGYPNGLISSCELGRRRRRAHYEAGETGTLSFSLIHSSPRFETTLCQHSSQSSNK